MSARLIAPLFYAICFIIGILLLTHSFAAEYSSVNGKESMLYPQVIIGGWILFSLAALIEDFIKKTELDKGNWRALGLAILSVTFLFLALVPLGFVISGFLFFCMYAFALGYKKPIIIIILSAIATTGTLWWLFEVFLEIPLPTGIFFS